MTLRNALRSMYYEEFVDAWKKWLNYKGDRWDGHSKKLYIEMIRAKRKYKLSIGVDLYKGGK